MEKNFKPKFNYLVKKSIIKWKISSKASKKLNKTLKFFLLKEKLNYNLIFIITVVK